MYYLVDAKQDYSHLMREDKAFEVLEVDDAKRIEMELRSVTKSKGLRRKPKHLDYVILFTPVKKINSLPDLPVDAYVVYTGRGKPAYKFGYKNYQNPYTTKYLTSVIASVNGCSKSTAKYICEELGGHFTSINSYLSIAPSKIQLLDAVQYFSGLQCDLRKLIKQLENLEDVTELEKITDRDAHSAFVYFSKAGGPRPIGLLAGAIWNQSLEEGTTYFDLVIFLKWIQKLIQSRSQSKAGSTRVSNSKTTKQQLFYLRPTSDEVLQLYRALSYL